MTIDYTRPRPGNPLPPPPPQPPRGWWSRNWAWVVPVGCLLPVLVCGGFFAGIFFFVGAVVQRTDGYQTALNRARANPEVVAALGTPIEPRFWVIQGSSEVTDESTRLKIPIKGPKGTATIVVNGRKVDGRWAYSTMLVRLEDGRTIDLSDAEPPPSSTPESPGTDSPDA